MRINPIEALDRAVETYPLLADLSGGASARAARDRGRTGLRAKTRSFSVKARNRSVSFRSIGQDRAGNRRGWPEDHGADVGRRRCDGLVRLTDTATTHFQARALSRVQTIAFDGAKFSAAFEYDHSLGYEMMKRLLALVTERLDHTRMQIVDMYGKAGAPRR